MDNQKQGLEKMEDQEIVRVYEEEMKKDFPEGELKPLKAITSMLNQGIYDCLGYYEEGQRKAYAFSVRDHQEGNLLLDYLAVSEKCRGGGYGSRCMQEMKSFYKKEKGILLECESLESTRDPQEIQIRQRRICFYERNGCIRTRVRSRLFGVDYEILYLPLSGQKGDVAGELERLYRLMFSEDRYNRWVTIWK